MTKSIGGKDRASSSMTSGEPGSQSNGESKTSLSNQTTEPVTEDAAVASSETGEEGTEEPRRRPALGL